MTPGLMWSPDPRALVILRHSEGERRGEDGAGLLALAQLLRRLSELSDVIKIRRGNFPHLDCSQRLLDCAGEALVRSVDAGLLVCRRANLGQDKLIVIDKGLLKRPECEIVKSLLHTSHYLGAGRGPAVDDELDGDLGAGGALQHQDVA